MEVIGKGILYLNFFLEMDIRRVLHQYGGNVDIILKLALMLFQSGNLIVSALRFCSSSNSSISHIIKLFI